MSSRLLRAASGGIACGVSTLAAFTDHDSIEFLSDQRIIEFGDYDCMPSADEVSMAVNEGCPVRAGHLAKGAHNRYDKTFGRRLSVAKAIADGHTVSNAPD